MIPTPITYYYEFEYTDDKSRPHVLHEFAANGAKHLILSDALLSQILARPSLARQLQKEMADEGLTFRDSHAPFGVRLDLNCPIPQARPEMLLRLKLHLRIAADMGVRTMTIHTGNETHYPDRPLEEQYDCIRRSLDELLPFAESAGVTVCLENIWFRINTPERLLKLTAEFPSEALGLCYDAGHANLMDKGRNFPDSNPRKAWGDIPVEWEDHALEKMLPQVVNCHLHDNDGIADRHRNPGCGTVDWPHIIGLLKQAPRLQCIQSEVHPVRSGVAIRALCARFRELAAL